MTPRPIDAALARTLLTECRVQSEIIAADAVPQFNRNTVSWYAVQPVST
jgi:hypothetical protein